MILEEGQGIPGDATASFLTQIGFNLANGHLFVCLLRSHGNLNSY
jgi:hypothetical protein